MSSGVEPFGRLALLSATAPEGSSCMWLIFQLLVMFAVLWSNIEWHWIAEPGPSYLPVLVAIAIAWLATKIVSLAVGVRGPRRPAREIESESERLGAPDSRDRLEPDRKSLLGYRHRQED